MEYNSVGDVVDKHACTVRNDIAGSDSPKIGANDGASQGADALKNVGEVKVGKEDVTPNAHSENKGAAGEVNMEAAITTDDVIRAGGFGATDAISSLLPAAVDSTDFEASLRDARDFEEPQEEKSRPGLGWTEAVESE